MAGANIPLSLDNRRFIAGMQQSAGAVGAFVARMNVDLANAGKQADYFTSRFNQGFGRMAGNLKSTGQNLSTFVTAPLAAMAGAAYKTFGDIDALERSLSQYGVTLSQVKQLAKLPGLGIEEAAGSLTSLLSVKYDADLARRALMGLGNALTLTGKGKAELEGINTALAQMKGKGKVSAEEINQIAERLPMIRDLMQKAFGTADTEVLQKMGLSADEFLSKITAQLEKLPKATAGPKAILENFFDSVKIGAYEVGKAFERNFALSAKFEALGNKIDELSQRFAGLDPNVQKAILTAAGFAAAAGPVMIVLGQIVSIAPKVATAWTLITGPVGLAVAAVTLMVTTTENGMLTIANALGTVTSLLTGNWRGAWESGVATVRGATATILELASALPRTFMEIGISIADALNLDKGNVLQNSEARMRSYLGVWDEWIAKIAGVKNGLDEVYGKISGKISATTGGMLNEQVIGEESGKKQTADNALLRNIIDKNQIRSALQAKIKELNESAAAERKQVERAVGDEKLKADAIRAINKKLAADIAAERAKEAKKGISDTLGGANPRIAAILAADKKAYEDREKVFGEHLQRMAFIGQKSPFNILPDSLKLPKINFQGFDDAFSSLEDRATTKLIGVFGRLRLATTEQLSGFAATVGSTLSSSIGNAFDSLGQALAGKTNFLTSIFGILADAAAQLGKSLIAMGTPLLFLGPPLGALGLKQVLAGGALVAGSSLIRGFAKFAQGGIVSGPVYGLMGEYDGVRNNPEVIAPLAKLRSMLLPMFRQAVDLGRGVSASSVPGPAMLAVHVTGGWRQTGRDLEFVIDQRIKANAARTGR